MNVILLFSGVFKSVWREIKTCWNYLSCSICLCFEQWKNNIRNYWGVNDTVWTGYLFYTWLFMFSIRNFSEIQSSMSAALHTKPKKHSWLKPFISTSAVLYLIKITTTRTKSCITSIPQNVISVFAFCFTKTLLNQEKKIIEIKNQPLEIDLDRIEQQRWSDDNQNTQRPARAFHQIWIRLNINKHLFLSPTHWGCFEMFIEAVFLFSAQLNYSVETFVVDKTTSFWLKTVTI